MSTRFRVCLNSTLYSALLYDCGGDYVYDLNTALREAEEQFGDEWTEVFNGLEGVERQ